MARDDQADRLRQLAVFALPLALALTMVGIKLYDPSAYHALIQEDNLLENAQFCCYLAAGLLCLWAAVRFRGAGLARHAGAALLVGLALLAVAGDEISWGERLLGYRLPEFFARYNAQHEVTLHNLKPVQAHLHALYMLAGLGLSLGWLAVGKLLARPGLGPAVRSLLDCFIPPWTMALYFMPLFLIYSYFIWGDVLLAAIFGGENFAIGKVIVWRDQEPAETLLALGCLVWSLRLFGLAGALRQAVHRDEIFSSHALGLGLGPGIKKP